MPCIIRNAMLTTNGSTSLSLMLDDLVTFCKDKCQQDIILTVDVTPDGHGDAIRTVKSHDGMQKCMFVKPQEQEMSIIEFKNGLRLKPWRESSRRHLETDETGKAIYPLKKPSEFQPNNENTTRIDTNDMSAHFHFERVLFYSRQNDCLQTELRPLFDSGMFPETINFAQEVFGVSPDAVNLWIGNEQAVSSIHNDHYENLFYVLTGENVFVLCPPADAPFLYQAEFDSGTFQQEKSGE